MPIAKYRDCKTVSKLRSFESEVSFKLDRNFRASQTSNMSSVFEMQNSYNYNNWLLNKKSFYIKQLEALTKSEKISKIKEVEICKWDSADVCDIASIYEELALIEVEQFFYFNIVGLQAFADRVLFDEPYLVSDYSKKSKNDRKVECLQFFYQQNVLEFIKFQTEQVEVHSIAQKAYRAAFIELKAKSLMTFDEKDLLQSSETFKMEFVNFHPQTLFSLWYVAAIKVYNQTFELLANESKPVEGFTKSKVKSYQEALQASESFQNQPEGALKNKDEIIVTIKTNIATEAITEQSDGIVADTKKPTGTKRKTKTPADLLVRVREKTNTPYVPLVRDQNEDDSSFTSDKDFETAQKNLVWKTDYSDNFSKQKAVFGAESFQKQAESTLKNNDETNLTKIENKVMAVSDTILPENTSDTILPENTSDTQTCILKEEAISTDSKNNIKSIEHLGSQKESEAHKGFGPKLKPQNNTKNQRPLKEKNKTRSYFNFGEHSKTLERTIRELNFNRLFGETAVSPREGVSQEAKRQNCQFKLDLAALGENEPLPRLGNRHMVLTFSHVDDTLTHTQVLQGLSSTLDFYGFIVARELHKTGQPHYHVYLDKGAGDRFTTKQKEKFFLNVAGKTYKPFIQAIGTPYKCVSYFCKKDNYISNLPNLVKGRLLTRDKALKAAFDKGGEAGAAEYYLEDNEHYKDVKPQDAAQHFKSLGDVKALTKIDSEYNRLSESEKRNFLKINKEFLQTFLPLETGFFQELIVEALYWVTSKENSPLVVTGPSGLGKTELCFSLLKKLDANVLVVNNIDEKIQLKPGQNVIFVNNLTLRSNLNRVAILLNSKKRETMEDFRDLPVETKFLVNCSTEVMEVITEKSGGIEELAKRVTLQPTEQPVVNEEKIKNEVELQEFRDAYFYRQNHQNTPEKTQRNIDSLKRLFANKVKNS